MAAASSNEHALPGDRLLVYYKGEGGDYDDVWHERLLLWPSFGSYWAIRTPDGDEYVEDVLAGENLMRFLPLSGTMPRRADLGAQVYRFAEVPAGDALISAISRGKLLVDAHREEIGGHGQALVGPPPGVTHCRREGVAKLLPNALAPRRRHAEKEPGRIHRPATPVLGAEAAEVLTLTDDEQRMVDDTAAMAADAAAKKEGAAGGLGEFRRRMAGLARDDEAPAQGPGEAEPPEDCRTMAILRDPQGQRWREWRSVCTDLTEPGFDDWPVDDGRSVVWLCRHMLKHGMTPSGFVEIYLREKGIPTRDRASHELRHIAEVLEYLGCYDQCNLGALAAVEMLARRFQAIIAAHRVDAQKPNYEDSKYYRGMGSALDAVNPELTAAVTRRLKDEAEIERQRHKAAEARKPGGPKA